MLELDPKKLAEFVALGSMLLLEQAQDKRIEKLRRQICWHNEWTCFYGTEAWYHTLASFTKRMRFGSITRSSSSGNSTSWYAETKTGILYHFRHTHRKWVRIADRAKCT